MPARDAIEPDPTVVIVGAFRAAIHRREPTAQPVTTEGDPRTLYRAVCGAPCVHTDKPDWSLRFCRYCWPGNLPQQVRLAAGVTIHWRRCNRLAGGTS